MRGNPAALARPIIAMVGSRNASGAGLKFAERLALELGQAGYVIASGLARGIDAAAHRTTLKSGSIAVLAGGQDRIYPDQHVVLLEALLPDGAAISEMPFGWEPRARDFPRRNRIVSGLSLGVVVVEAAKRSGSLITARFALEQGREVFAVPGSPIDPRTEGTNDLLKQGATTRHAGLGRARCRRADPRPVAASLRSTSMCVNRMRPNCRWRGNPGTRERVIDLLGPTPVGI